MSEQIGPVPTEFDKPQAYPKAHELESFPIPPPRKKARRKKRTSQIREHAQEVQTVTVQVTASEHTISLADIKRAQAVLAAAGAALGVAQPKKDAPVPLHPQGLEDPAQGDKTPAVVEWYRDNAPEEYKRRYSGRKTHMEDKRKERPYQPLPEGALPATFPADPDGFQLSQHDDSGRAPRNYRDI